MLKEINIYGAGGIAREIIKIIKQSNLDIKINVVVTKLDNNYDRCENYKVHEYKEFIQNTDLSRLTFIVAISGEEGDYIKKILTLDRVKKIITVEEFGKMLFSKFWETPLKKNMIVFSNFDGKGYGDNPKYICNKIDKSKYECIWVVNDMKEVMPIGIKKVKYGSLEHYRALAEAHFWVDNMHKNMITQKRLGQIYIQTWHGEGPLKKIEYDSQELPQSYYNIIDHDVNMIDYFISGSEFKTKQCKRAFRYHGCILETGNPRDDIFFCKKNYKESIFPNLKHKKWILYAPTYRKKKSNVINPDIIISRYREKFNEDCIILIKEHPNMTNKANIYKYSENVINMSNYPDTQELLMAADILITDYSSVYFDYMLLNRPIGFAVEDMEKYKNKRGFIFDNPKEYMPGPEIRNLSDIEEFIENIVSGNDLYKEARESVNDKINYYKDGNCCKRVAETFIK